MKIKRILLTTLAMVLVAALSIAGTVAYLTSKDEDINVMTMPGVEIAQHEFERVVDADGNYKTIDVAGVNSYKLQNFTQDKPIYPIVGDPNGGYDSTEVRLAQLGHNSRGGMSMLNVENAQDKLVVVENTGKSDAYVRTIVAFEAGSVAYHDWYQLVKYSYHFTWTESFVDDVVEIDGNNYYLVEFVYNGYSDVQHPNGVLTAGDYTYNSLAQVYILAHADNAELEALDGNDNGKFDILVMSQAVQTAGFANAETALDAAFGDITTTNHPWVDGVKLPEVVNDDDALIAALANGKDVILADDVKIEPASMSNAYGATGINVKNGQAINGNGNVLDIKGAGGTWDSGICTSGGLIENITVTGSFRGIFVKKDAAHNETVVLNNVTLSGTTYTISCDSGSGAGLVATNSTFNGWTSYAKTIGEVSFTDCSFGAGNGYAYCRPYAPTTFVGCDFEAGYKIDARAAVTFENCTFGGVALTAANVAELVTGNTANATVIG